MGSNSHLLSTGFRDSIHFGDGTLATFGLLLLCISYECTAYSEFESGLFKEKGCTTIIIITTE